MVDKKMSHKLTLTAQYNITFENTLCRSRKKSPVYPLHQSIHCPTCSGFVFEIIISLFVFFVFLHIYPKYPAK